MGRKHLDGNGLHTRREYVSTRGDQQGFAEQRSYLQIRKLTVKRPFDRLPFGLTNLYQSVCLYVCVPHKRYSQILHPSTNGDRPGFVFA